LSVSENETQRAFPLIMANTTADLIPFETLLDSTNEGVYGIDTEGRCTFLNRAGSRMLGFTRYEVLGRNMHRLIHHSWEDGAPYAEADCPIFRARQMGEAVRVEHQVLWRKDHSSFHAEFTASPIVQNGERRGVVVTFSDISQRRQQELRMLAQYDVSRTLAESTSLAEGLPKILQAIGARLGWQMGAIWLINKRRAVLRAAAIWCAPELEASEFETVTREMTLPRGAGSPGRVWLEGKPLWIADVKEDSSLSPVRLKALGNLRSMVAFPLRSVRKVTGVVEFFSQSVREPDDDLLRTLATLGNQIGEFVERVRNDEELRTRDRAITSSINGIVITDASLPDNPVVYVNPAFERLTGYSAEEAAGRNCRFLQGPDTDRETVQRIREAIAAEQETNAVLLNYQKDGTTFWNDLTIAPVRDEAGVVTHFIGVQNDVTERKRAEEELIDAKEEAEVASRAKSQFLANMSHELRTPLNAIIGYSEMLQEQAEELHTSALVPDLLKIHSAGKHLLALINDILDLSKIEAGKMDLYLESFDVGRMVREVSATIEPLIERKGNQLSVRVVENLPMMRADLTKVRQSLFNLLSNSAKFTEKGAIELAVESREVRGAPGVEMRVTDAGIGMTPEQLSRLFEPFTQADRSTTRKFGGTGLGLAITRRFVQMMGGDIRVESEPGRGSTFRILLPLEVRQPQEAASDTGRDASQDAPGAQHAAKSGQFGTVLVIDDDATARDLMRRYLEREAFQTVMAESGEEGLRLAREQRPDVITLDVMMPKMDGWAVLQEIKSDARLREIPVIMVTIVDDKNLGYTLGADDYMTKPVDREQLATVLQKYRCPHPPCPVLLVEDDETTRGMMRSMLERDGWCVTEAANGEEGLERVKECGANVILLDLMMPQMDGFEFIARLRRNEETRDVPVVVITAKELTAEERQQLTGSAQKVLSKGQFTMDDLLRQVRALAPDLGSAHPM
jgi:PAS domain S-box-containing protein